MDESAGGLQPSHISDTARRGLCLVLVSPSGGGKTSVMQRLLASDGIRQSVSVTTRPPRPGEVEGRDYLFRTPGEFQQMVDADEMLEHATVHARSYGIPRAPVQAALEAGQDLVFAIDWKGHATLREKLPGDVVGIFLMPPSHDELKRRLAARGDAEEDIEARLSEARHEITHASACDHIVVNDDLEQTISAVRDLLQQARYTRLAATSGSGCPAAPLMSDQSAAAP